MRLTLTVDFNILFQNILLLFFGIRVGRSPLIEWNNKQQVVRNLGKQGQTRPNGKDKVCVGIS